MTTVSSASPGLSKDTADPGTANRLYGPLPDVQGEAGYDGDHPARVGFFTDTSVCIGCKACEVACKEWNLVPDGGFNLLGVTLDPNVYIQDKVGTCDIRPGRRPRGAALTAFVDEYRRRSGVDLAHPEDGGADR